MLGCTEATTLPDNIETDPAIPYMYYIDGAPLVIQYENADNGIVNTVPLTANGCWFSSDTEFRYPATNSFGNP